MTLWQKLALAFVALVLLFAGVVAMQPATFSIQRTLRIAAPPAVVAAHIENLRAMDVWSPWAQMDPEMRIQYEGPEAGVGARSSWEGPQMGKGRLTVTAVQPERIEMQLEMLEPMHASNQIRFYVVPVGADSDVTWQMDGHNNFIGKAFSLVMDMDEMVGVPFEQGLAALKTIAESDAAKRAPAQ
jgi:hypothetical protein